MRNARGDAPQSRKTLVDLQLCIDAFNGVEVAQSHERSHALAVFLDRLHAHADAPHSSHGVQVRLCRDLAEFVTLHMQNLMQGMPERKNFIYAAPQKVPGGRTEKFLRGRADHYGA